MKKSWFSVSINPALSKKISWGRTIETERPTHEGLFPPQHAELEEVLGSVGLGHLASQYRQHLDEQERRGGAQGNHPLVLMSSDAYRRMLAHNKATHRARRIPRENERESMGNREGGAGMPYGYDERGGSLGGESFKDSQGRKFLVVRDFSPSEEPHDKGTSIPMSSYVAGNGLIPIGLMHSHPPSAFGSQPSAPDLYIAENGGANSPLNLIMYPYGPETEEPHEGFTAVAGTGNGQPVRGDRDALDASAYGRTAHTRAMYSEIGADKQARISAMDPRNIIVYDARKGGYALTPDEFGRGIHGPSLIPGEHFTAGPQVTESGYLMRNPVGIAGSDLIPRAPGMFGATADDIDPPPSTGTEPADIANRRETAKSWFNVSINPALRKSEEPLTQEDMANLSLEELRSMYRQPHYDKDRPGRIWAPAGTALFFSPDPEINRRVKVANTLTLTHSCLDYQDPNDFLDHEDPSKRAYAKFLLHHVVRNTAAHPIDDSYLESVRDILGQESHDYEKAALDGLPDKEGIEKHNQALMDTYVEKPAHAAVKRALAAGYSPHQSDAFGDWSQKGVLAHPFPMYTPGAGDDRSGGYTFFPSTHEDFVNAGAEPPPGIGHDSTPTDDTEFFFKSMKKSWFNVSVLGK